MDTQLRMRKKVQAGELQPGMTFKEIQKARCLLVLDLTQVDMFRNLAEGQPPLLRDDVVYCSELSTGKVDIIPKVQEVHQIKMVATEVDE